ncbi:type III pantothenate kinase [Hirschia baltica]|uniref:Type III pantothenate kinase n=1 Tax=Hirschia baltica (strain ATCC 49814 / DSM 5838 / IFAM 1418) TaxID=582402 RepID=C6XJW8_HIRBI|nr:type III pantothenate kinase [Hirschia baltica]ACT59413.1 putative transcriptional acitvator, Baf family [Hirschia baltica ATCC 49814]
MLLAVDTGNTNTLFAIHDGKEWRAQWRSATDSTKTADDYAVWLTQLMHLGGLKIEDIDACIISSVVPQGLFNMRNLARRYLNVEPFVIGENVEMDVAVKIPKPSEVGADRLVNAVGALEVYDGPMIVIDSGTATTFDIVGADGGFEGGIIAPGINLSMRALHDASAKLPRVAIQPPASGKIIGTDTVSAMQSGVFWGYMALIDGLVTRIKEEYGTNMTTVATGGVASLFEGAASTIDHFDPDLTIRGLLVLYQRNKDIARKK